MVRQSPPKSSSKQPQGLPSTGDRVEISGSMWNDGKARTGKMLDLTKYPGISSRGMLAVELDVIPEGAPAYNVHPVPPNLILRVLPPLAAEPEVIASGLRAALGKGTKLVPLTLEDPIFQEIVTPVVLQNLDQGTLRAAVQNLKTLMQEPSEAIELAFRTELLQAPTNLEKYCAAQRVKQTAAECAARLQEPLVRPAILEILQDLKARDEDVLGLKFEYCQVEDDSGSMHDDMAGVSLGVADPEEVDGIWWADKNAVLPHSDPFERHQSNLQFLGAHLVSPDGFEVVLMLPVAEQSKKGVRNAPEASVAGSTNGPSKMTHTFKDSGHTIEYSYRDGADRDLDDGDLGHIGNLLRQGFTSGEVCTTDENDEAKVHYGWWSLTNDPD